jgi:hypothetical protein
VPVTLGSSARFSRPGLQHWDAAKGYSRRPASLNFFRGHAAAAPPDESIWHAPKTLAKPFPKILYLRAKQ